MESKRRFGDRKDGRLIQSLAPFYKFMPYIMPTKNDACNQFEDCIEITNTDRWLRQKRLEGYKGLGYLHLFIAAYIRMVSLRPGINRFVAGRRIYARNNIEVVLTVRRSMSTTSNETTIKAVFAPTDTIFDVYRKMNEKIDEIKFGGEDNNTEQVAGALLKLPRFLLRFAVSCLRVMDYFGIIPQKLLDASPFHGSMIITDMGSLRRSIITCTTSATCRCSSPSAPSARRSSSTARASRSSASTSTSWPSWTSACATGIITPPRSST